MQSELGLKLLFVLVICLCLQLAVHWPQLQSLSQEMGQALVTMDPAQTVMAREHLVYLTISPGVDETQFVVLVNGQARGTFRKSQCAVAVSQGDLIEIDSTYPGVAAIIVSGREKSVLIPVVGHQVVVENSRAVLAQILLDGPR